MITKWKLANFKSVQDETTLDFAPLTIFSGANSSGKSTLLQSILLISQTLSHKDPTHQVVLNGHLIKLGEFSDIQSNNGVSNQIIIGFEVKPPVDFLLKNWPRQEELKIISCDIMFGTDALSPILSSLRFSVLKHNYQNSQRLFKLSAQRATENSITSKRKLIAAACSESIKRTLGYDVRIDLTDWSMLREIYGDFGVISDKELMDRSDLIGCSFWHFLPEQITSSVSSVQIEFERIEAIRKVIQVDPENCPFDFLYEDTIILPPEIKSCIQEIVSTIEQEDYDIYEQVKNKDRESPDGVGESPIRPLLENLFGEILSVMTNERVTLDEFYYCLFADGFTSLHGFRDVILNKLNRSNKFQALLDDMIRDVRSNQESKPRLLQFHINEDDGYLKSFFINSVRYIGPLRIDPEVSYPISSTSYLEDVGLAGENTAAVFETQKMRDIEYIPASCFNNSVNIPLPVKCTLQDAVIDWLGYLGVADKIESKDSAQFGHELQVCISNRNKSHDLTQVGVGVSQVLPIIVAGLLAESDTTLIVEQPELHLHPKVQSRLADFFLSMTQLGKQCLVETHSEHIINRIRLRIAEGSKNSPWQKATKIYFVEKKESGSLFREVSINEYGAIQDWPEGFFEEGLLETEKRIRATALKQHVKGRYN